MDATGDVIEDDSVAIMTAISVTLDDDLARDLDEVVAGGNRSAVVATAIGEYLDRRRVEAAAAWHASLTGADAETLAAFDGAW